MNTSAGRSVAKKEHRRVLAGSPIMCINWLVFKSTQCLAHFLRDLKKASSFWVKEIIREPAFQWQEGYAAFTVSASASAAVQVCISNQERHHRKKSFREGLIEFLQKTGIDYDERYLD